MTTAARSITADDLLAMNDVGRCELIRGEIIPMAPAGAEHGSVAGEAYGRIWQFVQARGLGRVYAAETGFLIARGPDTVRAADVAFVRADRLVPGRMRGFFPGAPNLVVEVVSPRDRSDEVTRKVGEWLSAGTQSVWVVNPLRQCVELHRSGAVMVHSAGDEEIRDEPTLPGFSLKVQDLLEI